jgi:hypothetical protein
MDKRVATVVEQRPGLTVPGLLGLGVVFVGVISVAPAFVSLIVAATSAAGWCWWLDVTPP